MLEARSEIKFLGDPTIGVRRNPVGVYFLPEPCEAKQSKQKPPSKVMISQ